MSAWFRGERRYADRRQAGERLAEELAERLDELDPRAGGTDAEEDGSVAPVVLGIPRGGVPVAAAVADALDLPLDVIVVEKVGAPWNPELALGAVGEGEAIWLDDGLAAMVEAGALERIIERERAEVAEKLRDYREVRERVPLEGRTAVVVDDGLATGSTARAALEVVGNLGTNRRVLAVPVGPPDTVDALEAVADLLICPLRPDGFHAVGQWYDSFGQVPQEEVVELLRSAAVKRK